MISIDETRCNLCGICVSVCVRRILEPGEKSIRIVDPMLCLSCGHCKAVCPTNAPRYSHLDNAEFEAAPEKKQVFPPQEFARFLRRRRSVRVYQNKAVAKEKLERMIEAGRFAPTGGNRQLCEYTVVSGRKALDPICTIAIQALQEQGELLRETLQSYEKSKESIPEEMASRQGLPQVWDRMARKWAEGIDQLFHQAPALIVIHAKDWNPARLDIDAGIISAHMVLMAEALGLATCYIGFLITALTDSKALRKALRIPPSQRPLAALVVGHPGVKYLRLVGRNPAKTSWIE